LGECAQPAASVAAVAMAHGVNANLVRKWRLRATGGSVPTAFAQVDKTPASSSRWQLALRALQRQPHQAAPWRHCDEHPLISAGRR